MKLEIPGGGGLNFWKLYGEILPLSWKVKSIKRIFTSENFFCDSHSKKIDDRRKGGGGGRGCHPIGCVIHIISCKFAVDDCKMENQPKTREGWGRWVLRIYDYKRWLQISTYGPTPIVLNFPYTNNNNSIGKLGDGKFGRRVRVLPLCQKLWVIKYDLALIRFIFAKAMK